MLAADPARASNPPWLVQHLLGDIFEAAHHYGGAGSSGQLYVNDYATQIASGRMSGVALVVHGEAAHSVKQIDKEAAAKILEETPEPPSRPDSLRITDMPQINPGEEEQQRQEMLHGLNIPNWNYAIYECAIAAKNGETIEEHRDVTGKVFSDFSKVAANDPISSKYAWFPEERGIDDVVREVDGNGNRMIAGPYFARNCCAFNGVDMGAAALVTSVGEARDLGISEDKWVYVHGVASTQDMQLQCSRASYSESIQHRVGFREAFKQAQLHNGPGDIDHFEIYSP